MTKNNLAVLIGQGKTEPWESIWNDGQVPTWINRYKDKYSLINCSGIPMGALWSKIDHIHESNRYSLRFGKWQGRADYLLVPWLRRSLPETVELPGSEIREIQVRTNSSYLFAGRRLLGAIKWFVEQSNYEFVFLTTTSSFINVNLLDNFINSLDIEKAIYAGQVLGSDTNGFVSGAGILMNRVCAVRILRSYKRYPFSMLNDAALGFYLREMDIFPQCIPWMWIKDIQSLRKMHDSDLLNTFHFRCKSSEFPRQDSLIMNALHKRLLQLSDSGAGVY